MASTRRASTDRGHRVENGKRAAHVWESVLPAAALGMPAELEAVDRLDDEQFFERYRRFFHATIGRPSIPIETYLRLMFLRYRYRLGFDPLCREVADSISWSRFCRIPLGGSTPHPTTLMKTFFRTCQRRDHIKTDDCGYTECHGESSGTSAEANEI